MNEWVIVCRLIRYGYFSFCFRCCRCCSHLIELYRSHCDSISCTIKNKVLSVCICECVTNEPKHWHFYQLSWNLCVFACVRARFTKWMNSYTYLLWRKRTKYNVLINAFSFCCSATRFFHYRNGNNTNKSYGPHTLKSQLELKCYNNKSKQIFSGINSIYATDLKCWQHGHSNHPQQQQQ